MVIIKNAPLLFKYILLLPLGGRGGVTRFFMITQGIQFEEQLFNVKTEWGAEKQRLVKSGENPSGSVPILYSNGAPHPQHIAAARYLARVHKLTSGDDYKDYIQDMVADEYQGFRNQWARTTFSEGDEAKAEYKKGDLIKHLTKFNALYDRFKTEDAFLSVSAKTGQPLWGDAAIYGMLRDHILTKYISLDDLSSYPRLMAMYTAYESIPAVKAWLASIEVLTDEKKSDE